MGFKYVMYSIQWLVYLFIYRLLLVYETSSSKISSLSSFRRLDELQSQLAEEKDKVASLNEQLQKEKSHKERELSETKEKHQSQISDLQEKIVNLVGISGQRYKFCAPCSDTAYVLLC